MAHEPKWHELLFRASKDIPEDPWIFDQLMEIAGNGVSRCLDDFLGGVKTRKIVFLCGSGNNGGDGLVAARYMKIMGYSEVSVYYPKQGDNPFYDALITQLVCSGIHVERRAEGCVVDREVVYVDCIVGFGFSGTSLRSPWDKIMNEIREAGGICVAVDVPSGSEVDAPFPKGLKGWDALISLMLPKDCSKDFPGAHYLTGCFVPEYDSLCLTKRSRRNRTPVYPPSVL
ncbi:putative NAD(P)H-hydrate epimerase [Gregarina niphandrodes]|uniref:NAD(P)H-hydrate epimerase n=1 Tax=Gregarina niphandrodes TaxID=110365 RepID=A0A023B097_GRENI|nr:putative NAD(P)H-hydrate epimerase [Gregarina niphandrodes]EZG45068.1 putative NAD(P)H-hydrate epimerase [Gregarina niphandrodes]|eukprot:XP_011132572.1 putative NAD(P)H-hydrate epimerase [Gregarina niphandrodes]